MNSVLIWSGEHSAFWKPESKGYCGFLSLDEAGRYTHEEAAAILNKAGPEKKLRIMKMFDVGDQVTWSTLKKNGVALVRVGVVEIVVPMHQRPFDVYLSKGEGFLRKYNLNDKWWYHKPKDEVTFLVGIDEPQKSRLVPIRPRLYHPVVSKLSLAQQGGAS